MDHTTDRHTSNASASSAGYGLAPPPLVETLREHPSRRFSGMILLAVVIGGLGLAAKLRMSSHVTREELYGASIGERELGALHFDNRQLTRNVRRAVLAKLDEIQHRATVSTDRILAAQELSAALERDASCGVLDDALQQFATTPATPGTGSGNDWDYIAVYSDIHLMCAANKP